MNEVILAALGKKFSQGDLIAVIQGLDIQPVPFSLREMRDLMLKIRSLSGRSAMPMSSHLVANIARHIFANMNSGLPLVTYVLMGGPPSNNGRSIRLCWRNTVVTLSDVSVDCNVFPESHRGGGSSSLSLPKSPLPRF